MGSPRSHRRIYQREILVVGSSPSHVVRDHPIGPISPIRPIVRGPLFAVRGEFGLGEARNRLKDFLRAEGYDPHQGGMRNLASTRRLNLILKQNAAMAHSAAEWKRMHDPDAMKVFPYVRYHARNDSRTRSEHSHLDGRIFRKDDPFLSTHTPPWEFNCRVVVSLKRVVDKIRTNQKTKPNPICLKRIVLHNPQKQTYCVMVYDGKELRLVSWHNDGDDYGNGEWTLE